MNSENVDTEPSLQMHKLPSVLFFFFFWGGGGGGGGAKSKILHKVCQTGFRN